MQSKKFLLVSFMISGMTALIYEIVWSRSLQAVFGSTIYAVSTILTTFFIGFALGSYFFSKKADNAKNAERIFSILQLAIGVYGIILIGLFGIMDQIYIALKIPFFQFLFLFLLIITPATLFGATWPVMGRIYIKSERIGKDAGKLYAFNSFGSFLGPIIAGFILIPLFGIKLTSVFAVLLNLFAGTIILINSTGRKNES